MTNWSNEVAVVTGARGSIGQAEIVAHLSDLGAGVAAICRERAMCRRSMSLTPPRSKHGSMASPASA